MRPTDKATADSRSVQYFAIIENAGHGNCFTLAVFTLQLEMDYPSETSLCTVTFSPTDTPSPFLLLRRGAAVHRLSEMDNPSSIKLSVKIGRESQADCSDSKLKPFHFQIKTYYLSDTNYQTDNPSHPNNPPLV